MSKIVGALFGRNGLDESADDFQSAATVRAALFRSAAFSLEKTISLGVRSGDPHARESKRRLSSEKWESIQEKDAARACVLNLEGGL